MRWEASIPPHQEHSLDLPRGPPALVTWHWERPRVAMPAQVVPVGAVFGRLSCTLQVPPHGRLSTARPALESVLFLEVAMPSGILEGVGGYAAAPFLVADPLLVPTSTVADPSPLVMLGSPIPPGSPSSPQVARSPLTVGSPILVVDLTNITTKTGSSLGSLGDLVANFCASLQKQSQAPWPPLLLRPQGRCAKALVPRMSGLCHSSHLAALSKGRGPSPATVG